MMSAASGTLFVVATPIGNLEDITPRAVETLRRAAVIACEDTRRSGALLRHLGIRPARIVSYHKFNERGRRDLILSALRSGQDVALVSDGGTPAISDPGAVVVEAALQEGLRVSPVPGPSAVAAAVSVSGFMSASFLFVGFLPAVSGPRRRALEDLRAESRPMLFLEAPHRVARAARDMLEVLGERPVTLVREATKLYEEVRRTTLSALADGYASGTPRGEFTLVVQGGLPARRSRARGRPGEETASRSASPSDLRGRYEQLLEEGIDRREALKIVMRESGLPRRDVYIAVRSK
jgi:16S rRNA (cytidine1402-2'-O)-methyltransferase